MSDRIQGIIQDNLDLIYRWEIREKYPNVNRLFAKAKTMGRHLVNLYEWMRDHPDPYIVDTKGNEYWTVPVSTLIAQYGGQHESWQSHIIMFDILGLIKRTRPNAYSTLERMKAEYKHAVDVHRRTMSFYTPVKFTEAVLERADEIAAVVIESGMSVGHITKADIIRHFGIEYANEIYRDYRTVSEIEQDTLNMIGHILEWLVEQKGYATIIELQELANDMIMRMQIGETEREFYFAAFEKFMKRKRDMCAFTGFTYAQQTKEDHEAFGTTENFWIIKRA